MGVQLRALFVAAGFVVFTFNANAENVNFSTNGYTIEQAIGLMDAEYTRETDGYRRSEVTKFNQAGRAAGFSERFVSGGGSSTWVYNGSSTVEVGLSGAEYTHSSGYQYSTTKFFNEAGQAAGFSNYWNSNGAKREAVWVYNGSTTVKVGLPSGGSSTLYDLNEAGHAMGSIIHTIWVYNGSTTVNVGLRDEEHTRNTDGFQQSYAPLYSAGFNEAGEAAGESTRYGSDGSFKGYSVWVYNGSITVKVGLTDALHTINASGSPDDGHQVNDLFNFNEAGQVVGTAKRYGLGGAVLGLDVWVYNGSTTVEVGLNDAEHTRETDGYRRSEVTNFNQAGQAAGFSERFISGGGASAWIYNGSSTQKIGLTDAEHTDSSGSQYSHPELFNEAGQAAGISSRYSSDEDYMGHSVWIYNGSSTQKIGLTDAEHTSSSGAQYNNLTALTEAGHVIGRAAYQCGSCGGYSDSVWIYNGTSTVHLGLTGAEHTRNDGFKDSSVYLFNEAGQLVGTSNRYSGSNGSGADVWFYNGADTVPLTGLSASSTGYAYSRAKFLSEEGLVLGYYNHYDELDNYVSRAFAYSDKTGLFDLGFVVDEGFEDWDSLSEAIGMTDSGIIFGQGVPDDGTNSTMAFKLSPKNALVAIDIDPWSNTNNISADPADNTLIPVTVLTTSIADGDVVDFDALQVDPGKVSFGPGGAANVISTIMDVDGDADDDILLGFHSNETGITCEDDSASLTGQTYSGQNFEGSDAIQTPACPTSSCHP